MSTFEIPDDLIRLENGATFVPLGNRNYIFNPHGGVHEAVMFRVRGITDGRIAGFWGTLGRADDLPVDWEGELYCSDEGNPQSTGEVARLVEGLRQWQPDNPAAKSERILERFIALDEVQFGHTEGSRNLRLTLMVGPNEGAIVFYHHGEPGSTSQEGDIEFILPAEGNSPDPKPGRKTFHFEVPFFSAEHNDLDEDELLQGRFVVKALVFLHAGQTPMEALRRFDANYRFVRYDAAAGFVPVEPAQVDLAKKTLLLVHGTFASTHGSFSGLHTHVKIGGKTWLQHLLEGGFYEQIIGFDHSTVLDDADTNVRVFKDLLKTAHLDWRFAQPVDIITTSRGGIVGKTLCNDAELNSDGGRMRIEKIALVSCANGAALLEPHTGVQGIRLLLSVCSLIPYLNVVLSVVQVAFTVYLKMPGTLAQTHDSPRLRNTLAGAPAYARTRYYPVCGNWEPQSGGWKFLDRIIDFLLEDANDGVNYTKRMPIIPEGRSAYNRPVNEYVLPGRLANASHVGYFKTPGEDRPQQYILQYLTDRTENWLG